MATLAFSAVGTALGGPLGGALGALVGNQFDREIVGYTRRGGSRLRELAVTTSSYGAVIGRHFGRMRVPGTVIWATNLKETQEDTGGSKGGPAITSYAYSASFAVALASRPIVGVGRIWADGNLLRGASGDLKVGGQLRIYNGYGDQNPDPLIASDRGAACPGFRDVAYCVFEDLQLADFGNRLPALTFEIIADDGEVNLAQLTGELGKRVSAAAPLPELVGFSNEGGPLSASLATIGQLYPITADGSNEVLRLASSKEGASAARLLPGPAVAADGDGFGGLFGQLSRRQNDELDVPDGLRYYDVERDYQAGMQRAEGRAQPGRTRVLEFPGALQARKARQLCKSIVQRATWSSDQLLWRIAEIDPQLVPGEIVAVPGYAGSWRIEGWEWRTGGVELDLRRLPPGSSRALQTDAGTILAPKDVPAAPTILLAFELPWNGVGSGSERHVYAAASSSTDGWTGAALYAVQGAALAYVQPSGSRRSTIGNLNKPIGASSGILLERQASMEVRLAFESLVLTTTTIEGLAEGRNRILVGGEVLQFTNAMSLGMSRWELSGLLRGRGGTEAAALAGHLAGAPVVLLDDKPVLLDASNPAIAPAEVIGAIGLADQAPVTATIGNTGAGRRPLTPVHPRVEEQLDGAWHLTWTRRARGAWLCPEAGEIPLNEQSERFLVGVGTTEAPSLYWETAEAKLILQQKIIQQLRLEHSGKQVWVRQIGTAAISDPLHVRTIS